MKTRSQKLIVQSVKNKPKVIETDKKIASRSKISMIKAGVKDSINQVKTRSQNLSHVHKESTLSSPGQVKVEDELVIAQHKMTTRSKRSDVNQVKSKPMRHHAGKKSSSRSSNQNEAKNGIKNNQLAEIGDYRVFVVGDLVWAKLKGWPAWPAKVGVIYYDFLFSSKFLLLFFSNFQVTKIITFQPFKVEVWFFNDGRTANVFASQMEYLLPGMVINADKVRKNKAIHKAAKDAMIHYFFSKNLHHQFMF